MPYATPTAISTSHPGSPNVSRSNAAFLSAVALLVGLALAPAARAQQTFSLRGTEYQQVDGEWYNFSDGFQGDLVVPERIVVRLSGGATFSGYDFSKVGGAQGLTQEGRALPGDYYVFRVDSTRAPFTVAADFAADPLIDYVGFDAFGLFLSGGSGDFTPDDVLWDSGGLDGTGQWNLRKLRMPEAWPISVGDPNVVVAIIDSYADYQHQELDGNLWRNELEINGAPNVDDDGNGCVDDFHGWDFDVEEADSTVYCVGDNDPGFDEDAEFLQLVHGTAVAGIALARIDNDGEGLAGIAGGDDQAGSGSRYMPLALFLKNDTDAGTQIASSTSVARALRYAAENGATVASMSFGYRADYPFLRSAIDLADASNVVLIAAAGNYRIQNPNAYRYLIYPAAYAKVLSVGATLLDDNRWSNTAGASSVGGVPPGHMGSGTFILDVMAPGGGVPFQDTLGIGVITATDPRDVLGCDPVGDYLDGSMPTMPPQFCDPVVLFGGTSAAAPHVSGLAALVRSIGPGLSPVEVRQIIRASADSTGCVSVDSNIPDDEECGQGRIDAFEALKLTIEDYGATLRRSFVVSEDWTITSAVDLRGLDLTIEEGATVTLDGGTLNLGNEDGTPAHIFVYGNLVGVPGAGSAVTCEGGGEVVAFENGFIDKVNIDFDMSCAAACLMARDGGTIRFGAGTHTFSGGAFLVNDGGTMLFDAGAEVVLEDLTTETFDRFEATAGSVFRFGDDAGITVRSRTEITGTAAAPVVFEGDGLAAGERWDGLTVDGEGSSLAYAEVSDAAKALTVRAKNVTLDHVTASANQYGFYSDYAGTGCTTTFCPPVEPATLTITNSTFDDNTLYGLYLRNATASLTNTTARYNNYGIYTSNATLDPLRDNLVAENTYDGLRVGAYADVRLASLSYFSGSNRVTDNGDDEIAVTSGGTLFIDAAPGVGNVVAKACGPGSGHYLLDVRQKPVVLAESVYWGDPGGPPAGAFYDAAYVDAAPYLTADPDGGSVACRNGGGAPAGFTGRAPSDAGVFHAEANPDGGATSAERGGDFRAWLRAQIREARQGVEGGPGAPGALGLPRQLVYYQRLDRADELGERGPTRRALRRLRRRLDGGQPVPPSLRRVAEAALQAEVHDALLHGAYATADSLLAAYSPLVTDEDERRALALASVSVDEQAGRYAEALATLGAVIAALPAEEADLAEDLGRVAEAVAAHVGGGARNAPVGEAATVADKGSAEASGLPATFALEAAYPNPFDRTATLPVALPEAAEVRVAVYDVLGREVAVVADGRMEAGRHALVLDGSRLASGVYLVRATCQGSGDTHVITSRLTLVR